MSQAQLLFSLFFPCCCLPYLSISSFVSTSINNKRIKRRSSPAPDNDVLAVTARPDFASLRRARQKSAALPDDSPGKAEKRTRETTSQTVFFAQTKEQARSPGSGLEGWMRAELLRVNVLFTPWWVAAGRGVGGGDSSR